MSHSLGLNLTIEKVQPVRVMVNDPNSPLHEETGLLVGKVSVGNRGIKGVVVLDNGYTAKVLMQRILFG